MANWERDRKVIELWQSGEPSLEISRRLKLQRRTAERIIMTHPPWSHKAKIHLISQLYNMGKVRVSNTYLEEDVRRAARTGEWDPRRSVDSLVFATGFPILLKPLWKSGFWFDHRQFDELHRRAGACFFVSFNFSRWLSAVELKKLPKRAAGTSFKLPANLVRRRARPLNTFNKPLELRFLMTDTTAERLTGR